MLLRKVPNWKTENAANSVSIAFNECFFRDQNGLPSFSKQVMNGVVTVSSFMIKNDKPKIGVRKSVAHNKLTGLSA